MLIQAVIWLKYQMIYYLSQFSTDLIQTKLRLQDEVESLKHLKGANEALKTSNDCFKSIKSFRRSS